MEKRGRKSERSKRMVDIDTGTGGLEEVMKVGDK